MPGNPLSGAEQNQRRQAALASAARRRGTGTKAKQPLTRETKARERVRRRSNLDAGLMARNKKGQQPSNADHVRQAVDAGKPLRMEKAEVLRVVVAARKRGLDVKSTKSGGAQVTLKSGKTITMESA